MAKTISYIGLFVVAGLIILGVVAMWATFIVENYREKSTDLLNWSPFGKPTSIAINGFWTTPETLISAALGTALVLMSVAFHLRSLRSQEVGAQQLEQIEKMKVETQEHTGA